MYIYYIEVRYRRARVLSIASAHVTAPILSTVSACECNTHIRARAHAHKHHIYTDYFYLPTTGLSADSAFEARSLAGPAEDGNTSTLMNLEV